MKPLQVRKGQFVYYDNELHQVHSVKSMFRKSIYLNRLKDMQRYQAGASDIHVHNPKHMDTFIFSGRRYTIDRERALDKGDYILVIKPAPERLDYYGLNAIEKVEHIDRDYVETAKDNGVRHHEYVVMNPDRVKDSLDIAYFDRSLVSEDQLLADESPDLLRADDMRLNPVIGDVYLDTKTNTRAMIVAITEEEVIFGHGDHVPVEALINGGRYTLLYGAEEGKINF